LAELQSSHLAHCRGVAKVSEHGETPLNEAVDALLMVNVDGSIEVKCTHFKPEMRSTLGTCPISYYFHNRPTNCLYE